MVPFGLDNLARQLPLFDGVEASATQREHGRSGTFIDNMTLPIHRWYRYSAGFSSQWVEQVLQCWGITDKQLILDPFAGSGTVSLTCDKLGIPSVAWEAHPVVARICRTKLLWQTQVAKFSLFTDEMLKRANCLKGVVSNYPPLVLRSYDEQSLKLLDALKTAWHEQADGSGESELAWLALTAILRQTSTAGTAQWQYILPNKVKKKVLPPFLAFQQQVEIMKADMNRFQAVARKSEATLFECDARLEPNIPNGKQVSAVITSPPYANNYDYADALRFEMSFWGEVSGWGDIHDKVRRHLVVSSSQHSSKERLKLDELLQDRNLDPIRSELVEATEKLAVERELHGGKKHYHTMVAGYCRDISRVLHAVRKVSRDDIRMCWVIGDSAPYGVYCAIDRWIGELAKSAGFSQYRFEKLRDRNIKWKNRKHRVPLKEGLLWIEG